MEISNHPIFELPKDEAMLFLANMIDEASQTQDATEIGLALNICEHLQNSLNSEQLVELYYFKANAWSALRWIKHKDSSNVFEWDQEEILNEVYWLRSSIKNDSFASLAPHRQCQILVNTGNILNHLGRPVEAIEYWNRALSVQPKFGMALVNKGLGLEFYAKIFYDRRYKCILLNQAYKCYQSGEENKLIWDGPNFTEIVMTCREKNKEIASRIDLKKIDAIELDGHSLGRSKNEREYRAWALQQRLFLNPLNDIGPISIAADDELHLPNMIVAAGDFPYQYGFFNQIKQEFINARYLLWEGSNDSNLYKKHFADKEVFLVNTFDYSFYGISIEKLKMSFRIAYSIFDKIGYFINDYWEAGLPERKVTFNKVWYLENEKKLNPIFNKLENSCLRGLYWLSKDLIDEGSEELILGQVMEPDASNFISLRNHLEHKYLKIHDDFYNPSNDLSENYFKDELAHYISYSEFCNKSKNLMLLTRAAIIYLSLAVHHEEKIKSAKLKGLVASINTSRL